MASSRPPSSTAAPPVAAPPVAALDAVLKQMRWGDVLLFKCRQPHTALIRTLSFTAYDHVAVVAADSRGELLMLEACVLGVRAFPLKKRVMDYANEFADVVAWRRLLTQRTDAQDDACWQFVSDVNGRRYSYDPRKIFFSLRRAGVDQADTVESSYYCSELVCALYQRCGLMRKDCRAASFWPDDLANGGVCERWLSEEVTLAPEVVLRSGSAGASDASAAPSEAGRLE